MCQTMADGHTCNISAGLYIYIQCDCCWFIYKIQPAVYRYQLLAACYSYRILDVGHTYQIIADVYIYMIVADGYIYLLMGTRTGCWAHVPDTC